jgi:SAM-dependent methyltransferase
LVNSYLRGLYDQTLTGAYAHARREVLDAEAPGWTVLDCGAASGHEFRMINQVATLPPAQYKGLEWNMDEVEEGRRLGHDIAQADLNNPLPFEDETFDCVFGFSVLEHLLNGCAFMREAHRVLKPGGRLVLLTPNISTYFTVALLLLGRMPSTGPHPDSNALLGADIAFDVHDRALEVEGDTPTNRHLVVFSYRALGKYLGQVGFATVTGRAFGLYPFPKFAQPLLQRIDPWHCHQMVFTATKSRR